ncbi:MAG: hypothetical protein ACI9MR_001492 [Myxococcota bacterium]
MENTPNAETRLPGTQERDPHMPADRGLPALGVLSEINAIIMMVYGGLAVMILLMQGRRLQMDGMVIFLLLAVVAGGLVRGGIHMSLGRLLRGRTTAVFQGLRRYIIAAGVFTVGVIGFIAYAAGGMPDLGLVAGVVVLSMWWPVTLAVLLYRVRVRQMFDTAETFELDLVPADRSIEGVGLYMVCFSVLWLALASVGLLLIISEFNNAPPATVIGLLAFGGTSIWRSVQQLRTGLAAMRGMSPTDFAGGIGRYTTAAGFNVGALALFLLLSGAMLSLMGFLVMLVAGVLLMAWPTVLRRVSGQAMLEGYDTDTEHKNGAAPDRGITAFGYLLIWLATFSLAFLAVGILMIGMVGSMLDMAGMGALVDAGDGFVAVLIGVSKAGITLWAGIECINMSPNYRTALRAFAIGWFVLSVLDYFIVGDMAGNFDQGGMQVVMQSVVAIVLAIVGPALALVLANRKLPAA